MKRTLLVIFLAIIAIFSTVGAVGCGIFDIGGNSNENNSNNSNNSNEDPAPEKGFTISCPTEMFAGDRVEITITKTYEFDMLQKDYQWTVIGENTVDGSFEFEKADKNNSNYFFRANYPGEVQIQTTNTTSGKLTSNIVTIKVKANEIGTVAELKAIANTNKIYALTADIDLSAESKWTSIEGFTGTLIGGEYKIKNFRTSFNKPDSGLFGTLDGTVKNLVIENADITVSGEAANVGIVAGKLGKNGIIENTEVSGTVSGQFASKLGGIVGYTEGKIENSINSATVSGYSEVGGIAGYILISVDGVSDGNKNKGAVSGSSNVGGIFGTVQCKDPATGSANKTSTVSNSENSGVVTGSGDNIGGIVGYQSSNGYNYYSFYYYTYLIISGCKNSGKVIGKDRVGGILGGGEYMDMLSTCTNSVDISGSNYVGGYVGYGKGCKIKFATNDNKITGKAYVGGIAGYSSDIAEATNNGEVVSTETKDINKVNCAIVGGIAGQANNVNKCINNADITVTNGGALIGGIVGCANNGNISDNENNGIITATTSSQVGGIAGCILMNADDTANDNKNNAAVSGSSNVGGIFGMVTCPASSTNNKAVSMSGNKNYGKITGVLDCVGGIIGLQDGTGPNGFWDEALNFLDDIFGMGTGKYYVNLRISNCKNEGDITGAANVGGIIGIGKHIDPDNLWSTNSNSGTIFGEKSGDLYGTKA